MRIGAIGGMGSVQPAPYIYNTNRLSSASLDPIQRIPDDPTAGKTDFSGLAEEQENENDLDVNETRDLNSVLEQQFLQSARNAERILPEMQQAFNFDLQSAGAAAQPAGEQTEASQAVTLQNDFGRGVDATDTEEQAQNNNGQMSPYDLWQMFSQGTAA